MAIDRELWFGRRGCELSASNANHHDTGIVRRRKKAFKLKKILVKTAKCPSDAGGTNRGLPAGLPCRGNFLWFTVEILTEQGALAGAPAGVPKNPAVHGGFQTYYSCNKKITSIKKCFWNLFNLHYIKHYI